MLSSFHAKWYPATFSFTDELYIAEKGTAFYLFSTN